MGQIIRCRQNPEEDELLQKLVEEHGARNWSLINKLIPADLKNHAGFGGVIILILKWSIDLLLLMKMILLSKPMPNLVTNGL